MYSDRESRFPVLLHHNSRTITKVIIQLDAILYKNLLIIEIIISNIRI